MPSVQSSIEMSKRPISFKAWSESRPLSTSLQRAEAAVRSQPRNPRSRWLLFELLCILGQWERAILQLQIWSEMPSGSEDVSRILRNLIQGEIQREKVLSGRAAPSTYIAGHGTTPIWMLQLAQALRTVAHPGNDPLAALAAGDELRRAALAQAPESPGCANGSEDFKWITDSDTRIGPICELTLVDGYRWIAIGDIRRLSKSTPGSLLDLVWSRALIELKTGELLAGHLPMRYPLRKTDRDSLLMGRETLWTHLGETGVVGHGQKVWSTDTGDMALHDLKRCSFN